MKTCEKGRTLRDQVTTKYESCNAWRINAKRNRGKTGCQTRSIQYKPTTKKGKEERERPIGFTIQRHVVKKERRTSLLEGFKTNEKRKRNNFGDRKRERERES